QLRAPQPGVSQLFLQMTSTLTMTGGTIDTGPAGQLALGGDVTATSSATQTASITGSGFVDLFGATRNFTVNDGPQAVDLQTTRIAGGAFAYTTHCRSTLSYNGDNTYTGTTTIQAGTLLANGNEAGSTISMSGGTLAG